MVERLRGRQAVEQRKRRMLRTNWLCEWCRAKGRLTPATVVDHIVPLARGGTDDDSNTRNLCGIYHQDATAEQFGHPKRVRIGSSGWPEDD